MNIFKENLLISIISGEFFIILAYANFISYKQPEERMNKSTM